MILKDGRVEDRGNGTQLKMEGTPLDAARKGKCQVEGFGAVRCQQIEFTEGFSREHFVEILTSLVRSVGARSWFSGSSSATVHITCLCVKGRDLSLCTEV